MPDPREIEAQAKERKIERNAARSMDSLAAFLDGNRPDLDVLVTHINLVRRDGGWLLVLKGLDGVKRVVMFRDVFYLTEFVQIAVDALKSGKWRDDKPWTP